MATATPATLDDIAALLRQLVDGQRPKSALIGTAELAGLMDVSESTVERKKAVGDIGPQAIRIGTSLKWNRAEVDAWLARPNSRGELHDAKTWPAIWRTLRG